MPVISAITRSLLILSCSALFKSVSDSPSILALFLLACIKSANSSAMSLDPNPSNLSPMPTSESSLVKLFNLLVNSSAALPMVPPKTLRPSAFVVTILLNWSTEMFACSTVVMISPKFRSNLNPVAAKVWNVSFCRSINVNLNFVTSAVAAAVAEINPPMIGSLPNVFCIVSAAKSTTPPNDSNDPSADAIDRTSPVAPTMACPKMLNPVSNAVKAGFILAMEVPNTFTSLAPC